MPVLFQFWDTGTRLNKPTRKILNPRAMRITVKRRDPGYSSSSISETSGTSLGCFSCESAISAELVVRLMVPTDVRVVTQTSLRNHIQKTKYAISDSGFPTFVRSQC
jgi:hypothetical protein